MASPRVGQVMSLKFSAGSEGAEIDISDELFEHAGTPTMATARHMANNAIRILLMLPNRDRFMVQVSFQLMRLNFRATVTAKGSSVVGQIVFCSAARALNQRISVGCLWLGVGLLRRVGRTLF